MKLYFSIMTFALACIFMQNQAFSLEAQELDAKFKLNQTDSKLRQINKELTKRPLLSVLQTQCNECADVVKSCQAMDEFKFSPCYAGKGNCAPPDIETKDMGNCVQVFLSDCWENHLSSAYPQHNLTYGEETNLANMINMKKKVQKCFYVSKLKAKNSLEDDRKTLLYELGQIREDQKSTNMRAKTDSGHDGNGIKVSAQIKASENKPAAPNVSQKPSAATK